MNNKHIEERIKIIDENLKIDGLTRTMMSSGDLITTNRLNMIVALLTLIYDEVKK